jgi:hypothetical protein
MSSLTFKKRVRKNIDHTDDGVMYLHHFGTGWQELVFPDHMAAKQFAEEAGCEYKGI